MIEQISHENPILVYPNTLNLKLDQKISGSSAAKTAVSSVQSIDWSETDKHIEYQKTGQQNKPRVCLKVIKQKVNEIYPVKQRKQKSGFDKVLALLREQRQTMVRVREQKRSCLPSMWKTFGNLMALEKQKFESDYLSQANNRVKQELYNELLSKNSFNIKSCKGFSKRIEQKSSQNKLKSHDISINVERNQLPHQKIQRNQQTSRDATYDKNMCTNKNSQRSLKNQSLNAIYKTCALKIRSKPKPYRLISNQSEQEFQSDDIKAKVESSFKSIKKNENLGKNILSSIVFDPSNVLQSQKRKYYLKSLQKRQYQRQERQDQSTKVLLRVGGIRFQLKNVSRFKTVQA